MWSASFVLGTQLPQPSESLGPGTGWARSSARARVPAELQRVGGRQVPHLRAGRRRAGLRAEDGRVLGLPGRGDPGTRDKRTEANAAAWLVAFFFGEGGGSPKRRTHPQVSCLLLEMSPSGLADRENDRENMSFVLGSPEQGHQVIVGGQ